MLRYPKPEPYRVAQARRRREWDAERHACVDAVWARAGGRCEVCGKVVKRADDDTLSSELQIGHVHEIRMRSRGGSPYDPENTKLLCVKCHNRAHGLRVAD